MLLLSASGGVLCVQPECQLHNHCGPDLGDIAISDCVGKPATVAQCKIKSCYSDTYAGNGHGACFNFVLQPCFATTYRTWHSTTDHSALQTCYQKYWCVAGNKHADRPQGFLSVMIMFQTQAQPIVCMASSRSTGSSTA